jgi:hypothetical protein
MGPDDPDAPSPMQAEKREARAQLYTGTMTERRAQFVDDLLAWADGHAIYVVGNDSELPRLLPGVSRDRLTIVKRIPTPDSRADDESFDRRDVRGPGGFGPGGFGPGGFGPGSFGGPGGFGGPGPRGGFGPDGFGGPGLTPGEDILIARYDPAAQ